MKYSIVYSSRTGNTKMLAETIRGTLSEKDCLYFGAPDAAALKADLIYIGFWTDRGSCDEASAEFLRRVDSQKVFLFGTAGFGGSEDYYGKILNEAKKFLSPKAQVIGSYMCQGKMPMAVRQRYEQQLQQPNHMPQLETMIENFDRALPHPDEADLAALAEKIKA